MPRWTTLFLVALTACASNSTQDHACSLVGCNDGVGIDLAAVTTRFPMQPLKLHVCLDASCQDAVITANDCEQAQLPAGGPTPALVLICTLQSGGTVSVTASSTSPLASTQTTSVSLSLTDATGAIVYEHTESVALTSSQPNGPDCAPTCYQGRLTLAP
jgi:hypothetical protein